MNKRMRLAFYMFAICLLSLFNIDVAYAAEVLAYPFGTNQDSRIYNDFNDHASYCMGCQGNDYDVPHGTPVYAVMSGTADVVDGHGDQADAQGCDDENINYGNYVKITSGSWEVIYGHMANGQMQVSNGSSVTTGQLLGYTSNSGYTCGEDYVTNGLGSSYHLHFEVEYNNVDVDPYSYDGGLFIIDSDDSYRYPNEVSTCTTSTYPVTLAYITDAFVSSGTEAGISTYYQADDNELNPYGEDAVVTETANPNYTLAWLSGDVDN